MRGLWHAITKRKAAAEPDPSYKVRTMPPPQRTVFSPVHRVCAITDVGRVRDHNEDAFHVSPDCNWFVVADGMGGHQAGEVAAALAIEAMVEHVPPSVLNMAAVEPDIGSVLLNAVAAAHKRVCEANRGQGDGNEMGCTLGVCCIADGLVTCHVGDVRCYIMRAGVLYQVTRDHSTVGALVEAGRLTPEEARVHPNKNEVLQAVGMPAGVFPDVSRADLEPKDRVLLCSDGLWEALSHEDIQSILASDGSVRQLAVQLVDRANSSGGHDNITVILCEAVDLSQTRTPEGGGQATKK